MSADVRLARLRSWANQRLQELELGQFDDISSVSDDASFRRYFRAQIGVNSYILVDAPPDKEDNESFVAIQARLAQAGLIVPELFSADTLNGYLLLSDLGDQLLLPKLKASDLQGQERYYRDALQVIAQLRSVQIDGLPEYDSDRLTEEMALFSHWFFQQFPTIAAPQTVHDSLNQVMALMIANALEQPKVFVHRDFHARNLMMPADKDFALIDFQDAVQGPVTYDLVSLLKDCYWRLPRALVVSLVEEYRFMCAETVSAQQFLQWFDFMGFQRHLKCAGIFSRLNLRDGKSAYLADIPLVIEYLIEVAEIYAQRFPELQQFGLWLKTEVIPVVGNRD